MKLITRKILKYTFVSLIVLIILGFSLKGIIARAFFDYETKKLSKNYHIEVSAEELKFKGIRTLSFKGLTVASEEKDTIAFFNAIETELGIANLLSLKINPLEVKIDNSTIKIQNILKYYNSFSKVGKQVSSLPEYSESRSITRINNIIRKFFGLSTARFSIHSLAINYKDSSYAGSLLIQKWKYTGNRFKANVDFIDSTGLYKLDIDGIASKKNNSLSIAIKGINGQAKIPFIEPILGISSYIDSSKLELQAKDLSNNHISLVLNARVNNLQLLGQRIAETPVKIDSASSHILVNLTPHAYSIDTLSTIKLNKLEANIGASYSTYPDSLISINLKTIENSWQELIESLPQGLFHNLSGIKVVGKYQYSLNININPNRIDSLTIEPKLKSKGFYIDSYGNANFTELNDTFTYKVYLEGIFIRSIFIGKANKNFTPLENISPYLRWAVITSEDGGFYNHRGFDLDGIQYAMACNIKERRFARGGSTISQQLIKNLYLNKNKNITRKFEEFLIVWMIENGGIVSKDRMLEIYLNIIEWGPNIYGVKEASNYYFKKDPNALTLQEALFLAYIIPRPTKFKYVFEDESHLKPFMINNFDFVSQKMLEKGYITSEDYSSIHESEEFKLKGEALNIIKKDTFKMDSTQMVDFAE
ncbi:glycosyl transferase [Tenuifilaceae bacterium CYCD]|nr:glycosyl transferase [Tenuifilaceae bacterium CYCD]